MPFMELENFLPCSQGPTAGHNIVPARTVSVRSTLMLTYPPNYA